MEFKKRKLNRNDHLTTDIAAGVMRIISTPVFLLVRIYCWVWDYDYLERFKRN